MACSAVLAMVAPGVAGARARPLVGTAPAETQPLSVVQVRLPRIFRSLHVRGTYVQVSGGEVDLEAVNAGLRGAVVENERYFWNAHGGARLDRLHGPMSYGIYQASPLLRLTSASSVVVSAMVPVLAPPPAGDDGAYWFSITIDVATGRRVGIDDLVTPVAPALKAVAGAARKRMAVIDACVRGSLAYSSFYGFKPTLDHYRHFALTPNGLAIGFDIDQVTGSSCGRREVTLPYSVVRPYLNSLGRRLVGGIRRPRRA